MREAETVVRNARCKLRSLAPAATGGAGATVERLEQLAGRVHRIAEQTRRPPVDGETPDGATRLVSLHDPDARPIRKGRLRRPVEFRYKGQVLDNADGVILDWSLQPGNPADAAQLVPAMSGSSAGRAPSPVPSPPIVVTATPASMPPWLRSGVTKVCIPRKDRPGAARQAVESSRPFRRMLRWEPGPKAASAA